MILKKNLMRFTAKKNRKTERLHYTFISSYYYITDVLYLLQTL